MRSSRLMFWTLAVLAFIYALIFPLLTMDSLALLFEKADAHESRNLLLILFLELSRLFTSLVGVGVAAYLLTRTADRPAGRALALFLLFATITYEKVFGGGMFPGPAQEGVTLALADAGVSSRLLSWLFAPQIWTAWPALAALLRFSAVYPGELEAEALDASGREDRRGFLRGSGVAGADIGAGLRGLSRGLLVRGAYGALPLTLIAVAMIAVHMLLAARLHPVVFWGIAHLVLLLAVTNIRGGYLAADAGARASAAWITLGLVLALFIFLVSTAAYILIGAPIVRALAFGLMMLVPAVVMSCLALSVLASGHHDARELVHAAVRGGFVILAMMLVLAVVYAPAHWFSGRFGMSSALAVLAAVAVAAIAYVPVSRTADGLRKRILEHGEDGPGA